MATKVVGVGSVGTRCFVALFMSDIGDPLFLQVKEAGVLDGRTGVPRRRAHAAVAAEARRRAGVGRARPGVGGW